MSIRKSFLICLFLVVFAFAMTIVAAEDVSVKIGMCKPCQAKRYPGLKEFTDQILPRYNRDLIKVSKATPPTIQFGNESPIVIQTTTTVEQLVKLFAEHGLHPNSPNTRK